MRTDWNTQAPEKKPGDRGRFLDALAPHLEGTVMQGCDHPGGLCWGPGGVFVPPCCVDHRVGAAPLAGSDGSMGFWDQAPPGGNS